MSASTPSTQNTPSYISDIKTAKSAAEKMSRIPPINMKGEQMQKMGKDTDLLKTDPCAMETAMHKQCLMDYEGHTLLCEPYNNNYHLCRCFWNYIKNERLHAGKKPAIPPPGKERDDLRKEYLPKLIEIVKKRNIRRDLNSM